MGKVHWGVAAVLTAFLVPAFRFAHLPLNFAWREYLYIYYVLLLSQSVFLAALLFVVGYPSEFWRAITGSRGPKVNPARLLIDVALPGTYLFFVLVLVFAYNDVIATFRFEPLWDVALRRTDALLMGGINFDSLYSKVSPTGFAW